MKLTHWMDFIMKYNLVAGLVATLIVFSLITSCGGSSASNSQKNQEVNVSTPIVLKEVPEYQLEDTEQLLNDIDERLSGLPINDFFEQAYLILVERNHDNIIADGQLSALAIEKPELFNISDEFDIQQVAIKERLLDRLLSYEQNQMTQANQLSARIFERYLSDEIRWGNYREFSYPATYGLFGWPSNTERFFTDLIPVSTKEEAQVYIELANQVERRINQVIGLLEQRENLGIIEPKVTLDYSRGDVNLIANANASGQTISYYLTFSEKTANISGLSSSERQNMLDQMAAISSQKIIPAYKALSNKMLALSNKAPNNIGFGQFDGGKEFYEFTLSYFTSSEMTSAQIHQLGLDELERIHQKMRVHFDSLGYPQNESISQLFARVDRDGGIIDGADAISFYENIIDQTYIELPKYFDRLPEQKVVVIGGANGGFYIAGSDDGARPGAFYAYTSGEQPYTTMPTLAYHEALPGHHLQIAIANELDLPLFRRKINFTSFVEGWGLYAERLAKDVGWYENDIYGDLGRLQFEAMRASRLVIDTGIHAMGWTFSQAEQFSLDNIGNRGSIARYSVWPGQATAYTTGMLKILELRDQAEQRLGSHYNIKEFHSAVINNGSMPLDILADVVNSYIDEKE
jgi:uncharacterized protein (DUF885 family)